jgi:hypothetical protein
MVATRDPFGEALAVGRLAGREPLGFEAKDNNWYRFVANGPTQKTDPSGQWDWDGDWIQKGVGGLVGFYGSEVFVEGWGSNLNVAIHKDIHTQAATARAQAWQTYCDATNPIDACANLLFGVGLNAAGEVFAHGGLGIAEVASLGRIGVARPVGKCANLRGVPKPPGWNTQWSWESPSGEAPGIRRWWDPDGGEWRYHSPDKWHPNGHWDYNPWDTWNSPWRNTP